MDELEALPEITQKTTYFSKEQLAYLITLHPNLQESLKICLDRSKQLDDEKKHWQRQIVINTNVMLLGMGLIIMLFSMGIGNPDISVSALVIGIALMIGGCINIYKMRIKK